MKKELSQIIRLLASGKPVSGRLLGEEIGVSRTSVSKWVSHLNDLGMSVTSQAGVGYCLSRPLELLKPEKIRGRLIDPAGRVCSLEILDSVDSTNTRAMMDLQHRLGGRCVNAPGAQDNISGFSVVLAEHQTAGRGRRGRSWISPYASNINLSLGVRVFKSLSALSGLSLAIGLAIVQVLRRHGFREAGLKWPNDVLIGNEKLAGVLVDAQGEMDGPVDLCIGVGLNVRMESADVGGLIGQPWISLEKAATDKGLAMPDRSALAADLISELVKASDLFARLGFAYFQPAWSEYDAFANAELVLTTHLEPESVRSAAEGQKPLIVGLNMGVDEQGRLLLRHRDGESPKAYSGGEISVRRLKTQAQDEFLPGPYGESA